MRAWLLCLLLFPAIGCQSLRPAAPVAPTPPPVVVAPQPADLPKPPVEILRAAAAEPAPPPPAQPPEDDDPLVLVAECLGRDDVRGAALNLDGYVRAHPDQLMFRLQLADLYLRTDQSAEAKFHYELFTRDAATGPAAVRPHLVAAHTKLMEIAQRRNDRFGELFHRGVGLLLIAKQLGADAEADREFREEMFCKALKALQDAKDLKPADPLVRVHLADLYAAVGSRRASEAERAGARGGVVGGELTPAERGLR